MKYRLLVLLLLPSILLAEIGEFHTEFLQNPKWGTGGTISFYHQNEMLPSVDVGYFSLSAKGFYSPLKKLYLGGEWKYSSTTRSYPAKESLKTVGDISLWASYNFFTYQKVELWIEGGLYLFAPVEDESRYGDTSSYLLNFTALYRWNRFIPELTLGYFYDRRVNFSSVEPSDFERIAWQQIDYTWSHISPGIYYMGEDYYIFLKYRKEILYSSDIPFSKLPSYLSAGTQFRIYGNYYLNGQIRWKLYSSELKGYSAQPWVKVTMGLTYIAGVKHRKPEIKISRERANLTVIVENSVYGIEATLNGAAPDITQENQLKFIQLLPGSYTLMVTAPEYKQLVTTVTLEKGENRIMKISLKKVEKPASLMGFVASKGIPVENAKVRISGPITTTTSTDKDGIFKVEKLLPGSYSISVTAPDYQKAVKYVELTSGKKEVVKIELKEIEYPHAIITLLIKDQQKNPLESFDFKINAERFRILEKVKGKLKLYVAPGEITVIISSPGYKEKKLVFTVDDGDELTTIVKLKKK